MARGLECLICKETKGMNRSRRVSCTLRELRNDRYHHFTFLGHARGDIPLAIMGKHFSKQFDPKPGDDKCSRNSDNSTSTVSKTSHSCDGTHMTTTQTQEVQLAVKHFKAVSVCLIPKSRKRVERIKTSQSFET
jgi:hypothetical protein